jgi:hypothetical protein
VLPVHWYTMQKIIFKKLFFPFSHAAVIGLGGWQKEETIGFVTLV